jgi:hypothetical protein
MRMPPHCVKAFIQMVEGLIVVSGRVLQLLNLSSVRGRGFKYKENNLGVLYGTAIGCLGTLLN